MNEQFNNLISVKYTRELMTDGDVWSPSNMTDDELRQAIVQDILAFTMTEIETTEKFNLTERELVKFVIPLQRRRILDMLKHPEIVGLINYSNGHLRIRDDENIRQAAMDFCGVWYDGYTPTDPTGVITINTSAVVQAVEEHGGIDNLAAALAMEIECSHERSTIKH